MGEKEPTGGVLNSATGLVTGRVANAANAATNTVGVGNLVNGVLVTTLAPVTLTQSLAAQGLCNKHLWNMSLVIIIMSFLWCPCLLLAMVAMLWGTVKVCLERRTAKDFHLITTILMECL